MVTTPRMHHKAGRFIYEQYIIIFVKDIKRNIFRNNIG